MRFQRLAACALLLVLAGGCRHSGAVGAGLLAGLAVASAIHASSQPQEPVYVEHVVVVRDPVAPPPPPPVRAAARFDEDAARAALQEIDLTPCQARGVPACDVRARVTFGNAGAITRIVLNTPGLSFDAAACVGEQISTAAVPAFDGPTADLDAVWSLP